MNHLNLQLDADGKHVESGHWREDLIGMALGYILNGEASQCGVRDYDTGLVLARVWSEVDIERDEAALLEAIAAADARSRGWLTGNINQTAVWFGDAGRS